ncbi:thioesterase family protein [Streptomyces sp. NPDC127584]|uniref:thioesterase family protein n=1 Tax=Streptomyces sp. NPDC127584 TaxID=3345403 RepID=UPI00362B859D
MTAPTTGTDLTALIGTTATVTHTVTAAEAASNWGNGLDVLATPVLLWLGEITAMKVLENDLPEGSMTLGLTHDSAHLAPTPVGETVTLTATLTAVEGSKLQFEVEGRDGQAVVLRGTHGRALVDRARFTARLAARPTS